MELEVKPLLYAHSEGHTDVTYSEDGRYLISCGTDGDVRIWKGFGDDDPFQTCLGDYLICSKQKAGKLLVGGDDGKVKLLKFPSGETDGILTSSSSPINDISTSSNHNWVGIAFDDGSIQVIDITSKDVRMFPEFRKPVLSIAIDSDAIDPQYIALRTGHSSMEVISIEQKRVVFQEVFDDVPHSDVFSDATNVGRMEFDPIRKYLAYSRPQKSEIVVLQVESWSEECILRCDQVISAFCALTFSTCGKYLAASTMEGDLVIFSLDSQSAMKHYKHPSAVKISAIAWNPKQNGELAFCDYDGYIGLAVNCFPNLGSKNSTTITNQVEFIDDFAEEVNDDDDDNENAISLEKLKREVMGEELQEEEKVLEHAFSPRARSPMPEPPLQEAFMPTSSPEHLDPRYMCWNEIGIIRCYGNNLEDGQEEEDNAGSRSIEVEFNDCTMHNSIMVSNYQEYTMGTMSATAVALANTTTFKVIPLSSVAKDWTLKLNEEDAEIVALAASSNLICVATNRYLVHACTIHGIQKCVFAVPGPVISMSAFGYVLMIAYHSGSWRKGDSCVDVMLVKLEGVQIECRHLKAALAPESRLMWLGFTDVGTPAVMDSSGVLYLYAMQSNIWLPFCDTRKSAKSPLDGFFITSVYESLATVRGIHCRGSQYPVLTPVPTLAELPLQPPFLNTDSEKNQLEANLYTWSTLQIENTAKKLKETALKAFALSTKNDLNERALELMEMLQNPTVLSLALKYADKLGKTRLSENLSTLAKSLKTDDDLEDAFPEVSTPDHTRIKPNRKLLLSSTKKIVNKSLKESSNRHAPAADASQDLFSSPISYPTTDELAAVDGNVKNPFLKSFKVPKTNGYNPLSLTDKNAGVAIEKENKSAEKRKLSDTSPPTSKDNKKQKKLSMFTFTSTRMN